jgi:hypothetical protein
MHDSTTVYIDESGWTGADYINAEQPLQVLAAHWFDPAKSAELLDPLRVCTEGGEVKFAKLVRTAKGQRQLVSTVRLLSALSDSQNGFAAYVIDKKCALVRKFVLDCIHPALLANGISLFADGKVVGYANVIACTLPVFAGKEWYACFLKLVNQLVRSGSEEDNQALLVHCRAASRLNENVGMLLFPYVHNPSGALADITARGYRRDCYHEQSLGLLVHLNHAFRLNGFRLIIDGTRATTDKELMSLYSMLTEVRTATRISDVCTVHPDISIESVKMVDSAASPGVWVADIVAGLFNWCLKTEENRRSDLGRALLEQLDERCLIHMFNSNQVTPDQLGMEGQRFPWET